MDRRHWGWGLIAALNAVACGGQAELQAQDMDAGTPPGGFYSVSWQTVSDSCQPKRAQGTFDELVGSTRDLAGIVFAPTGHGHQDIPWDEPFFFTAPDCALAVAFDVISKTSHSFVVDSQIDWGEPTPACKPWALFGIPDAACSVHQIATYELEQACPATRNNVSCSAY